VRIARKYSFAIVGAVLLGAGLFAWLAQAPTLAFRDRAYPEGFRELVLEAGASRLDPLLVLPAIVPDGSARRPATPAVCEMLFRDAASPAIGRDDAPVQIAAFFDYRCPYCRTLAGILAGMQGPDIRVTYKEWPILGEPSLLAAGAALAADRQGKYLALHTRLMNTRLIPTMKLIEDLAAELGIDQAKLREDMRSPATAAAITRTSALAHALGFIGTPALVVGRTIAQGEISRRQLERLIEEERVADANVC
jgi:predicted DsbA family dithiol-disulfide isomerase